MNQGKANRAIIMASVWTLNACSAGSDLDYVDNFESSAHLLSALPDQYPDADFPGAGPCLNAALQPGFVTYYLSPTGSDSNTGLSPGQALATLQGVHDKLPSTFTNDYRVVIAGGEYRAQSVNWTKVSTTRRLHIEAAAGEVPVFDGRAASATQTVLPWLFNLNIDQEVQVDTNLTIKGLTIRHYGEIGILIRGTCNRLFDNKLINIGNAFAQCKEVLQTEGGTSYGLVFDRAECQFWRPPHGPTNPLGCRCEGYAAIDVAASSKNIFKHNDIRGAVNTSITGSITGDTYHKQGLMHAFYVAYSSQYNLLEDNFTHEVSGSVFKFRDGSSNNRAINNYIERSGSGVFFADSPSGGEPQSVNIVLSGNVATFGGEGVTASLYNRAASFVLQANQDSGKFVQGTASADEKVAATAIADIDSDGKPEVFVALNYPTLGFSKIVYSDGGGAQPYLRNAAYSNSGWQVKALAAGDFSGSGTKVVAAWYHAGTNKTQIATGALVDGTYRFGAGTKLGETSGSGLWDVTAMTAGRFGSDSTDSLITAAVVGSIQKVFRGDGKTAMAGASMPGVDNGTPIYSSASWRIPAMTNGTISGSTNSLITAFRWVGSGSPKNRIYLGDGTTGVATASIFDDATDKVITSLAFGRLNGTTQRLAIGFDVSGVGTIYTSDGTLTNLLQNKVYENQFWDITALSAGRIDTDTDHELLVAFDNSIKTEVHLGGWHHYQLGRDQRGRLLPESGLVDVQRRRVARGFVKSQRGGGADVLSALHDSPGAAASCG